MSELLVLQSEPRWDDLQAAGGTDHLPGVKVYSINHWFSSSTPLQLEGAFACVFKSIFYPGECVATRYLFNDIESLSDITLHSVRRGSPLLVGIKAEGLESDSIPVQYSQEDHPKTYAHIPADLDPTSSPLIPRKKTSAMFRVDSDHVSMIFITLSHYRNNTC